MTRWTGVNPWLRQTVYILAHTQLYISLSYLSLHVYVVFTSCLTTITLLMTPNSQFDSIPGNFTGCFTVLWAISTLYALTGKPMLTNLCLFHRQLYFAFSCTPTKTDRHWERLCNNSYHHTIPLCLQQLNATINYYTIPCQAGMFPVQLQRDCNYTQCVYQL